MSFQMVGSGTINEGLYKFHDFFTVPDPNVVTVRASSDAVRRPGISVTQLMLEADTV